MWNKIYIYGDSYASEEHQDYQWFKQLGAKNILNRAVQGASNDYIAHCMDQDLELHTDRDCVIVCTTAASRQWFFEDRPELGNFLGIQDLDRTLEFFQFEALKQYVIHLHNTLQDHQRGKAYNCLFQDRIDRSPAQGLVLPGFEPIQGVTGVLTDITHGEFTNGGTFDNYYENIQKRWGQQEDPRANHMTEANHNTLAEKILAALNGTRLDLTTGFDRDCL